MKKPQLIFLLIAVVGFVIYNFWATKTVDRQAEEDYRRIHEAAIKGKIIALEPRHHVSSFQVDNSDSTFIFEPVILPGKDFDELAEKGDSILKEASSDTLTLVKGSKRYRFHFRK